MCRCRCVCVYLQIWSWSSGCLYFSEHHSDKETKSQIKTWGRVEEHLTVLHMLTVWCKTSRSWGRGAWPHRGGFSLIQQWSGSPLWGVWGGCVCRCSPPPAAPGWASGRPERGEASRCSGWRYDPPDCRRSGLRSVAGCPRCVLGLKHTHTQLITLTEGGD